MPSTNTSATTVNPNRKSSSIAAGNLLSKCSSKKATIQLSVFSSAIAGGSQILLRLLRRRKLLRRRLRLPLILSPE